MRHHDFHLEGYTVAKCGGEITFNLVWNDPNQPLGRSCIRFSDVAVYHFIHTGGAIITDILEVPLSGLFSKYGEQIANWWRTNGGFPDWRDEQLLKQKGYSGWLIDSAIGFEGFVIARSIGEVAAVPNPSARLLKS